MKVLMLSWRGPFNPKSGGAEVYTEELLERLVSRGHEVEWYSSDYNGNKPTEHKGIKLTYGSPGMKIYPTGFLYARKQQNFDIIIDQINTFGFLGSKIKHTPVVSLIHQLARDVWDAETKPPISWIGKIIEPTFLKTYKKVPYITVSPSTEGDLKELGWNSKGVIVTNGLDFIERKYEKTEDPTLVFLARFGANAKRLDHAVQIFDKVRTSIPNAKLRVVGRGTPPKWIQNHENVEIHQNVSNEERDRLVGTSWCCIATSVREGWGRMVLESAMFETPSVVYDVHGLRDAVVHNETGLVVPVDINEAANKITSLLSNNTLLQELGTKAKEHSKTFTWETSTNVFEDFLKQIVAENKKRG